jgi:putative transcriptional regulator
MARKNHKSEFAPKEVRDALVADVCKSVDNVVAILNSSEKITLDRVRLPKKPTQMDASGITGLREEQLHLSQSVFARLLNVSPKTVQAWEQDVNHPSGASLRLLQIFKKCPEIVHKLFTNTFAF